MNPEMSEFLAKLLPAAAAAGVAYATIKSALGSLQKKVRRLEVCESWSSRKIQQMGINHNNLHRENQIELDDYPTEEER